MRLNAFVILTALVSFAAAATEPVPAAAPAVTPVAVTPAIAPTAPAAVAAPVAAAVNPLAANMSDQERASTLKWARMQGYKPTVKPGGSTVWCKSEATIGERIPHRQCATEETLAEMQRISISTKETLGEKMRGCAGDSCFKRD